ncbi:MAG: aldehyde dehydrogenase family protein [Bacteroidetes bacterium]|nr:MAG: aldehyde dehydrogenase family protein [Bacteroidota bacterium]
MVATQVREQHQRKDIEQVFELQRGHHLVMGATSVSERRKRLKRLLEAILRFRPAFQEAVWKDLRKPALEFDLTEIHVLVEEIRHVRRHLRRWMRPQPVPTPLTLFGSRSWIHYEPKGVVLIIAPWNYPVSLMLGPLVSAIAGGNCAILKPSEHTPHTSAVLRQLVEETFPPEEVALFEGGIETAQRLLGLPFHHIYFTGAPSVGKIVMEAASRHLASVTLELGGKSPTIIDESADLKAAARRTALGKFINNGQTCIAPDYLLVHESRVEAFKELLKQEVAAMYGDAARSEHYGCIVNERHFQRVKAWLDEALERGARVVFGGGVEESRRFVAPTLLQEVPLDCRLMREEIFAPLLPLIPFRELREAVDFINRGEKPLALYIFSRSRKNIRYILQHTRAGGTAVNHAGLQFFNPYLPFGGSNNSGIGKGHGWHGFRELTNARAVYKQVLPTAIDWLRPPYTAWKQKIVDFVINWL